MKDLLFDIESMPMRAHDDVVDALHYAQRGGSATGRIHGKSASGVWYDDVGKFKHSLRPGDGCVYTNDDTGRARLVRNAQRGNPRTIEYVQEMVKMRLGVHDENPLVEYPAFAKMKLKNIMYDTLMKQP